MICNWAIAPTNDTADAQEKGLSSQAFHRWVLGFIEFIIYSVSLV
jgi:hypothetical protein